MAMLLQRQAELCARGRLQVWSKVRVVVPSNSHMCGKEPGIAAWTAQAPSARAMGLAPRTASPGAETFRCSISTAHPGQEIIQQPDLAAGYDGATVKLVTASTVSFALLLLPQILQNSLAMSAGDLASLSILSWVVSSALQQA